jgi:DNA-binding transcriptional LysR family regulator
VPHPHAPTDQRRSPRGTGILSLPGLDLVTIKQVFVVAECLSLRRAAQVLGVTLSDIARRMKTTRRPLGRVDLQQDRPGVRLTEAEGASLTRCGPRWLISMLRSHVPGGSRRNRRVRIGIPSSSQWVSSRCDYYLPRAACGRADRCCGRGLSRAVLLCPTRLLDVAFVLGSLLFPNATWNNSGQSASL